MSFSFVRLTCIEGWKREPMSSTVTLPVLPPASGVTRRSSKGSMSASITTGWLTATEVEPVVLMP